MRVPKNVFLLVLAVTIHNIPEGFVQGISFGSLRGLQGEKLTTAFHQAVILAFAIGMQNIPEGLAVSVKHSDSHSIRPRNLREKETKGKK
jgi:ZIP family zinc transporter